MKKDRILNIRIDDKEYDYFRQVANRLRLWGDSAAGRYILHIGTVATDSVLQRRWVTVEDQHLRTFLNELTVEQKQELLRMTEEDLGTIQVERLHRLAEKYQK